MTWASRWAFRRPQARRARRVAAQTPAEAHWRSAPWVPHCSGAGAPRASGVRVLEGFWRTGGGGAGGRGGGIRVGTQVDARAPECAGTPGRRQARCWSTDSAPRLEAATLRRGEAHGRPRPALRACGIEEHGHEQGAGRPGSVLGTSWPCPACLSSWRRAVAQRNPSGEIRRVALRAFSRSTLQRADNGGVRHGETPLSGGVARGPGSGGTQLARRTGGPVGRFTDH